MDCKNNFYVVSSPELDDLLCKFSQVQATLWGNLTYKPYQIKRRAVDRKATPENFERLDAELQSWNLANEIAVAKKLLHL